MVTLKNSAAVNSILKQKKGMTSFSTEVGLHPFPFALQY